MSYQVDLGLVERKRKRETFDSKAKANAFAEQCRVKRDNEGTAAFAISPEVRLDATKANEILGPHGVTILEAARFYQKHVLAYKTAPLVTEIVSRYIEDCKSRNLRPRTIGDLGHRLNHFASDFGDRRLSDITLDELKAWVQDDEWEMRTRINYLTKLSQLYGYALKRKWVDSNLSKLIDRPQVDETTVEVFTVDQAQALLSYSNEFDLLPYIALGLFAGLRSAEMGRLDSKEINFEEKSVKIGADVAKKRAQRNVEMQEVLFAWLEPCTEKLQKGGPLVDQSSFRRKMEQLLEAAKISDWPSNGLRHSFASYHLAKFGNSDKTAFQMGHRSTDIVHRHYKALIKKDEAEKYWNLRPVSGISHSISHEHQASVTVLI